jgi:hypothetical protein
MVLFSDTADPLFGRDLTITLLSVLVPEATNLIRAAEVAVTVFVAVTVAAVDVAFALIDRMTLTSSREGKTGGCATRCLLNNANCIFECRSI